MKKIFLNAAIFIVLLTLTDIVVGEVMRKTYENSKYGIFGRQAYCTLKSNEEIIIMGSSRASHHYIPSIIEDSLNMTCYNAGSDGMCIYYFYGLLSTYTARLPKIIVLDVTPNDVVVINGNSATLDAALDRLSPHYGATKELDELYALKGPFESIKNQSKMYQFNSKLVQFIKCNFIPSYEDKGYEALDANIVLPEGTNFYQTDVASVEFDESKIEYLKKFIDFSKSNNIELIFTISPEFLNYKNIAYYKIEDIAKDNNIKLIDFRNRYSLMHHNLFADIEHLNHNGAEIFTCEVARELKIYKNNQIN